MGPVSDNLAELLNVWDGLPIDAQAELLAVAREIKNGPKNELTELTKPGVKNKKRARNELSELTKPRSMATDGQRCTTPIDHLELALHHAAMANENELAKQVMLTLIEAREAVTKGVPT